MSEGRNGLAPGSGLAPGLAPQNEMGPQEAMAPQDIHGFLRRHHGDVKRQFEKVEEQKRLFENVKIELDELLGLGDLVDVEDVVKGASKMIRHGVPAMTMAGLLADMPPGAQGEGLKLWLQQKDGELGQMLAAFEPVHAVAQHRLGVSALGMLMAEHLNQIDQERRAPAVGNQLAPGGAPQAGEA